MSEHMQVIYMQIRIIRMASEQWGMSLKKAVELFSEFDVLNYIEEFFGIFHTEGDEAILYDIEKYLTRKGAVINADSY